MEHELARGLEPCREIGETEADRLMLDDRLAQRRPLARIADRDLQSGLRHAADCAAIPDPPGLEIGERDRIAAPLGAEQQLVGDETVLEAQRAGVRCRLAELVLDLVET